MNEYSIKARIYPIVFILIPIVILGITYSIQYKNYLTTLSSLTISGLFAYFFSNIGRDAGKKKENKLWQLWGGMPSAQLMNFDDNGIDRLTKEKYHSKLLTLAPINETVDFKTTDQNKKTEIYSYWTKFLISQTRDTKLYSLLFYENISYGFRRNLWALKPIGIIILISCIIINVIIQEIKYRGFTFLDFTTEFYVSETLLIILLLIWIFIINPSWVKIPAFSYANRLLESVNNLKTNEANNI